MMQVRNTILNIMKRESGVVLNYELDQNYPNPFNPSTTIRFTVPEKVASVKLEIFNVLGQKIWNETLDDVLPGIHEVVWSGRSNTEGMVASGIYFYKITAGSFTSLKRMALIK